MSKKETVMKPVENTEVMIKLSSGDEVKFDLNKSSEEVQHLFKRAVNLKQMNIMDETTIAERNIVITDYVDKMGMLVQESQKENKEDKDDNTDTK